ncbi:hypothetical protein MKW98_015929, partial [Papaver atlanticum]
METSLSEQLRKRIQELEAGQARLKQELRKLTLDEARPDLGCINQEPPSISSQSSRLSDSRAKGGGSGVQDGTLGAIRTRVHPEDFVILRFLEVENRSAEIILYGYSVSEVLGQNVLQLLTCDRDKDEARHVINMITLGETWSGTISVMNKLGRRFAIFVTNSPINDDKGNFLGVVGVVVDSQSFLRKTPFPSLETCPSSRQPKTVTSTKNHINSQKPPQVVVSTKIWNMASKITNKVRSKLKTNENTMEHEVRLRDSRHFDQGEFSRESGSEGVGKIEIHKIIASRAESLIKKKRTVMESNRSGDEASGPRFSTINASSTSSGRCTGSTSTSSCPHKFDIGVDPVHYDILWEDLKLGEQIGTGSCGIVYHGFWCGSDVAVKVFSKFDHSDDLLHSFRQEVLLMKRLRHPNVLLFMGATTGSHGFGYCTRYYLHLCNPPIVHRDLKSSNLKVGDFGLSRIKHATFLTTKSGNGTPQWMAPEVMRDEPSDEKSDVYSFGVILWELATQKIPWDTLNSFQ